jgi:hypothetical protein
MSLAIPTLSVAPNGRYATPMLHDVADLPLHPREAEIRATEAMEAEIQQSGTGIPPLMMDRTPENRQVLAQIGKFLTEDIPPVLAMTDPARYRMLCRLRMEIILRGYYDSFRKTVKD